MKKIIALMLALGLAVPVNAISSVKKMPAPVTNINYVACAVTGAVVGVVAFIAGLLVYKGTTIAVMPSIDGNKILSDVNGRNHHLQIVFDKHDNKWKIGRLVDRNSQMTDNYFICRPEGQSGNQEAQ
jgi:hypothetical protein